MTQQERGAAERGAAATTTGPERVPTEFDWQVYADATFAGLAVLLPFPFVDSFVEEYFKRRMPRTIAHHRGRALPQAAIREINRDRTGLWPGCLFWPLKPVIYLIRNLWRTFIYVLSVYDASENLSRYWHRAFLLNYMIGRGHLDTVEQAKVAGEALHRVLQSTQTSPLFNLAEQVVDTARSQLGALTRAFLRFIGRRQETQAVERTRLNIAEQWAAFQDYLVDLAHRYDAVHAEVARERAAKEAASA